MRFPHLFEFMDLDWLPSSLRATLREILECGNSKPFRSYYDWVAHEVLSATRKIGAHQVVELGAGTAPITRHMARDPRSDGLRLVVCDRNPSLADYAALAEKFPGKIHAIQESVNFAVPRRWEPGTLLVLSATLHHIPSADRPRVIASLTESAEHVAVFEPLRKSILSILFVFLSTVPALLLPALFIQRSGQLRRILWCWILPLAPLMFWWDGIVSCLRQWTEAQWGDALSTQPERQNPPTIKSWLFCQQATW